VSRSGYCYDLDHWDLIRWRGAVASAIRGQRGQAFLREMLVALDSIPEKRLIQNALQDTAGEVCAIGAVGKLRSIDMTELDPHERDEIATAFGIAEALAAEIVYENDECACRETPEQRWARMREWVLRHLARPHQETTPNG